MTDVVKRARSQAWLSQEEFTLAHELADEIERLRSDVKIEWDCGIAVGKKQVLDDMREWAKNKAIDATFETQIMDLRFRQWLDAYEKDRLNEDCLDVSLDDNGTGSISHVGNNSAG